jgi:hypothetical protein
VNPSTDPRLGVPRADWLAFIGLAFLPTAAAPGRGRRTALVTTGCDCDQEWKRSAFRWPLWSVPVDRDTAYSLVGDPSVAGPPPASNRDSAGRPTELAARGVMRVLQAPIRRSDQGGYGSFGAAMTLVEAGLM